jgi:hypothetical protein
MHLKVFLKLKKPYKILFSGQIYKKKNKKNKKNKNKKPTKTQKKPTGLVFFLNPGFFQPWPQAASPGTNLGDGGCAG